MNVQRERRLGVDRREHTIFYRYGSEHRENIERREAQIGEKTVPTTNWVVFLGDIARYIRIKSRNGRRSFWKMPRASLRVLPRYSQLDRT